MHRFSQVVLSEQPCRSTLRDLLALVSAARLLLGAQVVYRGTTVENALAQLSQLPLLPSHVTVAQATCSIRRAKRILSGVRWFRDGCLVRALALGVLIADRSDVLIHVGFRAANPGDEVSRAIGHAWVTCRGDIVSDERGEDVTDTYVEATQLTVQRHP